MALQVLIFDIIGELKSRLLDLYQTSKQLQEFFQREKKTWVLFGIQFCFADNPTAAHVSTVPVNGPVGGAFVYARTLRFLCHILDIERLSRKDLGVGHAAGLTFLRFPAGRPSGVSPLGLSQ
jgi:hypothetical protein